MRGRNFRRRKKASVDGVEALGELLIRGLQHRRIGRAIVLRSFRRERLHDHRRRRCDLLGMFFPRRSQSLDQRLQSILRDVRRGKERLAVRRQNHIQRPAGIGHQLARDGHVRAVDVRPFLAIDFDGDEVLVHRRADRFVRKRLGFHHVTPVAGRVADRKEDQFVLFARGFQRGLAPRIPIDGIGGVLQEIARGFVREAVGMFRRRRGCHRRGETRAPKITSRIRTVTLARLTIERLLHPRFLRGEKVAKPDEGGFACTSLIVA